MENGAKAAQQIATAAAVVEIMKQEVAAMKKQARIHVVGLGSGGMEQLTLGIVQTLERAKHLYLRTEAHPAAEWLSSRQIHFHTFDEIYRKHHSFDEVYDDIVRRLLELAQANEDEIVYAVPGHPMIAEKTVQMLLDQCPANGIELKIDGGMSFLDQAFLSLGLDPISGFQLLDGTALEPKMIQPHLHTIIAQIYDRESASDVKLTLMERYPDDHPVIACDHLGIEGMEVMQEIPLYELDRLESYGNLFMVYIPKTDAASVVNRRFERLHEIVGILRSPNGCPWDREQTHESIRKNLIEETYEVLETIDDDDPDAMREELGDLLLQVMLHAQMEEEEGVFNVYDVIETLNEKLIRRHPHVFAEKEAGNAEQALQNWEQIKAEEKRNSKDKQDDASLLDGVPRDLPGLLKALEYQKKAAKVGFDWEKPEEVLAKIEEELQELKEAAALSADRKEASKQRQEEELGDLLFSVVNLARFLNIDPELAIVRTNKKFYKRFSYIEKQLRLRGEKIEHTDLIEMERLWQAAKQLPPSSGASSSEDLK